MLNPCDKYLYHCWRKKLLISPRLSESNNVLRSGRCGKSRNGKANHDGIEIVLEVEPVLDIGEVAASIFVELEHMVGSGQRRLEIAEDRIHRTKRRVVGSGLPFRADVT